MTRLAQSLKIKIFEDLLKIDLIRVQNNTSMQHYKSFLLLCTLTLALACSCGKDDDNAEPQGEQLPPITTEGANTFGCLVNGEVWLPAGGDSPFVGLFELDVDYNEMNNNIRIQAKREVDENINQTIALLALNADTLGIYTIKSGIRFYDLIKRRDYYIDTLTTRQIEILRLDTENDIVSGTFEFTAIDPDSQDTVRVTEGRFDAHY